MSKNLLKVQPIRNGTVIDHIVAGRGRKILDVLEQRDGGTTISLLINVQSQTQKRKDIIKIEDRELDDEEIDKLALISPKARINIVRNYSVSSKNKIAIPKFISGIVRCPNENCICNNERGVNSNFGIVNNDNLLIKCTYCGRKVDEENITFL